MSTSSAQLSTAMEVHRNHYLFSDYYLGHLLPRRLDWPEADSEARAVMKRPRTTRTSRPIDLMVFRLYGFTDEEVAVVEGSSYAK